PDAVPFQMTIAMIHLSCSVSLYGIALFSHSCRFLHPPHGLMPTADVSFAMVSPRPRDFLFLSVQQLLVMFTIFSINSGVLCGPSYLLHTRMHVPRLGCSYMPMLHMPPLSLSLGVQCLHGTGSIFNHSRYAYPRRR